MRLPWPYTIYSDCLEFDINTTMQTYEHTFTMAHSSDYYASVCFESGAEDNNVFIDNVELIYNDNNIVLNGDFENGFNSWQYYIDNSIAAEIIVIDYNKEFKSFISNGGSEMWHVHLRQDGILLKKGHTYIMKFDAKSELPRSIYAMIEQNGEPWTNYSNSLVFNLSKDFKIFQHEFTMSSADDNESSICIEFGTQPVDVVIDNVELIEKSTNMINVFFTGTTGSIDNESFLSKELNISLERELTTSEDPIQVQLNLSGNATKNVDYNLSNEIITFTPGGIKEKKVYLNVYDDYYIDSDPYENILVELEVLTGAGAVDYKHVYNHVIIDNDNPAGVPPLRKNNNITTPYFGKPTSLDVAVFGQEPVHETEADYFNTFSTLYFKNNLHITATGTAYHGAAYTKDKFQKNCENKDFLWVSCHGNDGFFCLDNGTGVNVRGVAPNNVILAGDIKFLVSQSCFMLFTGNKPPHDATGYLGAFKGAHAILGHISKGITFLDPYCNKIPQTFMDKWTDVIMNYGIYPAWRDAQFEVCYDFANIPIAPGVVFTIGAMKGQFDKPVHYWGWEEKYYNLYNGAAFLNATDKTNHPAVGEVLQYDPNLGYPNKIGHKWAEKGTPSYGGLVIW